MHQAFPSFTISQRLLKPCPLSQWCHPTTSFYVAPFSSCPPSFSANVIVRNNNYFTFWLMYNLWLSNSSLTLYFKYWQLNWNQILICRTSDISKIWFFPLEVFQMSYTLLKRNVSTRQFHNIWINIATKICYKFSYKRINFVIKYISALYLLIPMLSLATNPNTHK